jgi:hypothetical protein
MTTTEKLREQESRIHRMASYKYIELGELLLRHRYTPIADFLVVWWQVKHVGHDIESDGGIFL